MRWGHSSCKGKQDHQDRLKERGVRLTVVVVQWCSSTSTAKDIVTATRCRHRIAGMFFVSTEYVDPCADRLYKEKMVLKMFKSTSRS